MKISFHILLVLLLPVCLSGQVQIGVDIDGEAAGDQSGRSTSISADGSRVAIGAIRNDDNGSFSGQVRVYELNGTQWAQLGNDIEGEAAGDELGSSVSLSADGNRMAIGAAGNDDNGSFSGQVKVFEWSGGQWVQLGEDINGEAAGDRSGQSVSLSADGNRVAIGAPENDGNSNDAGHVRVYELVGTQWVQLGDDIDGDAETDQSGTSTSLSTDGNRLAIGAPFNGDSGAFAGHVKVYELTGTEWVQLGGNINGEAINDVSGTSTSLSADGNRVAVGANRNDDAGSDAGHVRVYELSGAQWVQLGGDIDGEAAGDQSGVSTSLSADGKRVAIGASLNDGTGSLAGHVRVYELSGTQWKQLGEDIDGEAGGDQSGTSTSLSADGNRVAIGALNNNGNGSTAGHVRVYDLTTAVLPVTYTSFTARKTAKYVALEWQTATETESDRFVIEHATMATAGWQPIGTVTAAGTSTETLAYAFNHTDPVTGMNYYRIKQMDFDGTLTYTTVVSVDFRGSAERLTVFPNPSTDGSFTVNVPESMGADGRITIYDITGRLLRTRTASAGRIEVADLARGQYIVEVHGAGGRWQKLVVVR